MFFWGGQVGGCFGFPSSSSWFPLGWLQAVDSEPLREAPPEETKIGGCFQK